MKKLFFIYFLLTATHVFGQNPGDLATDFGTGGKVLVTFDDAMTNEMRSMAIRKDGKILLAGHKHTVNGSSMAIVRLNKNGTIDSTFGTDGMSFMGFGTLMGPQSMRLQEDGRILVGGTRWFGGKENLSLMRLTEDGLLDTSFSGDGRLIHAITSGWDQLLAIALQKDGKILVAGYADSFPNKSIILVRFHPNGDLDTGFIKNGILGKPLIIQSLFPASIHVDLNGDIFIAGIANDSVYGQGDFAVIKIKADGRVDSSYGQGGAAICDFGPGINHYLCAAALQSDGSMIVVGDAGYVISKSTFAIARFTPNGSLDSSFGTSGKSMPDLGFGSEYARDVTLQPDKKILIAGTTDSDVMLVRMEADGSLDSSFGNNGRAVTDFGPNSMELTKCVALQPGGNIIVALATDNNFAALAYLSESGTGVHVISADREVHSLYPNPSDGIIRVKGLEHGYFTVLDACGRTVVDGFFNHEIDLTLLQPGVYLLSIETPTGLYRQEVLKE